jgi:hypothetical protein
MHIIFKRIPTGQTVMMMMPWLPIEIIKENNAIVYASDILTIIEPKDDLIEYYGNVVFEAQQRMAEPRDYNELDDEEEDDEEELTSEEILDLIKEKKKNYLH